MNNHRTKIGVLGAGSWGTVLSEIVSSNGYEILLWSRNKNTVDEINNKHTNKKYTGNKKLCERIKATTNQKDVLKLSHVIISIPSSTVRAFFKKNKKSVGNSTSFLIASKGLERGSFKSLSEILHEELSPYAKLSVLSGPNLASEIIEGMTSACVIASKNKKFSKEFLDILDQQNFKVFLNDIFH